MEKLLRKENENERQYLWRIGKMKDSGVIGLSWDDIADLINKQFHDEFTAYKESAYRKPYQEAKKFFDAGVFSCDEEKYLDDLTAQKHEIKKEKQKLFDERVALNKELREQARRESMIDVVKYAIDMYKPYRFEYQPNSIRDSDNDLIIHLTDIHCGMQVDGILNSFNTDILSDRFKKYLDEIRDIQNTYKSQNAYLILGGDLIHGLIHLNARLEAKENIVQQLMIVSDLIGDFIYHLSEAFQEVKVYTTAGNHSRSTSRYKESRPKENFDILVPYICQRDLRMVKNVSFEDNQLDYDIATFKVRGHMVYAVHGNKDKPKDIVYNMMKLARKANLPMPELCYMGHMHTNSLTTIDDVKVIQSGSVGGMDRFAIDNRLVGTPEQTVTVVTERNAIKALCDIQID